MCVCVCSSTGGDAAQRAMAGGEKAGAGGEGGASSVKAGGGAGAAGDPEDGPARLPGEGEGHDYTPTNHNIIHPH